ncbi:MAG: polyprenyl synthetase family protein [Bacteroidales bacterium]|nr:MAG: polyprenyl synthetase family protein [Bacteroidales bacterium]
MYTFEHCQDIINKELEDVSFKDSPVNLYEPIRYILFIGGKRLRPSLTLMGCNLFSDKIDNAIYPALAIELFHNFTLMHDDLMDKSDIRRNYSTVHKKWNENIAILSGDAMLVKSYECISKCQESLIIKALKIFNEAAIKVCEGQQYDMDFENRTDVTIDEYLEMIELKTASLIAGSLRMGALAGKSISEDADLIHEFGKNIGIAFQLQDDLLDVYADPSVFGKSSGGDIVANKKTYLLISALNSKDQELRSVLRKWIEKEKFDRDEKIKAITEIYNKLKLKELTTARIDSFFKLGLKSLDKVSISDNRKIILRNLIKRLIGRKK